MEILWREKRKQSGNYFAGKKCASVVLQKNGCGCFSETIFFFLKELGSKISLVLHYVYEIKYDVTVMLLCCCCEMDCVCVCACGHEHTCVLESRGKGLHH